MPILFFRVQDKDSSASTGNSVLQEDVEKYLMDLFLPSSSISHPLSKETDSERNRGGYTEDGLEGKTKDYVSERTMDVLLRELRKTDRDRDRVLLPVQIRTLFSKHKV